MQIYEFKDRDITGEIGESKYIRLDCLLMEEYKEAYEKYDDIEFMQKYSSNYTRNGVPFKINNEYDSIDMLYDLEKEVFSKFIDNLDVNIERYLGDYIDDGSYVINVGNVGAYMDIVSYSRLLNRLNSKTDGYNPPRESYNPKNKKTMFVQHNTEKPYFMKNEMYGVPTKINMEIDLAIPNDTTTKVEEILKNPLYKVFLKHKRMIIYITRVNYNKSYIRMDSIADKKSITGLISELKQIKNKYGIMIYVDDMRVAPTINRMYWEMETIKFYESVKNIEDDRQRYFEMQKKFPRGLLVVFSGGPASSVFSGSDYGSEILGISYASIGLGMVKDYSPDLSEVYIEPILVINRVLKTGSLLKIKLDDLIAGIPLPGQLDYSAGSVSSMILKNSDLDRLYVIIPYYEVLNLKYPKNNIGLPIQILGELEIVKGEND